jgi:hypothetical protein
MTDTFASGPHSPLGGHPETSPGAPDVTSTLAELERKLRELEHELTSIGQRRAGSPALASATEASGSVEPDTATAAPVAIHTQGEPRTHQEAGGRLVDEAVERREPVPAAASVNVSTRGAAASSAQLTGLAELRLFRDRLERFARELSEDYEEMLERVVVEFTSGASTPPSPDDTPFEGRVELGVGPFYDITSLGAFEQAVARVPHASDVAVRRFEASHAVLDLNLSAPVALVRELRAVLDTDFNVREIAGARLMLTFDDL